MQRKQKNQWGKTRKVVHSGDKRDPNRQQQLFREIIMRSLEKRVFVKRDIDVHPEWNSMKKEEDIESRITF